MADEVVLEAAAREGSGRTEVRRLRANGRLPGVIYGTGIQSRALDVDRHQFIRALHAHGAHPLVTIKIGADEYLALVKDVQIHAVRHEALHVDFLRVEADKPVHAEVALSLVGEPRGVKLSGGVLEAQLRTLTVQALPRSIPEVIELDVSELEVGDVVRVSDIKTSPGVTIMTDADETVATVSSGRVEVPPTAAEEEAAAAAVVEAEAAETAAAQAGSSEES